MNKEIEKQLKESTYEQVERIYNYINEGIPNYYELSENKSNNTMRINLYEKVNHGEESDFHEWGFLVMRLDSFNELLTISNFIHTPEEGHLNNLRASLFFYLITNKKDEN
jgi:predicted SPOUT superfamily RNA methylase MTH1